MTPDPTVSQVAAQEHATEREAPPTIQGPSTPAAVAPTQEPAGEPAAPQIGDYVLATKYSDGDPGDPWALGFYAGVAHREGMKDRHMVNDSTGKTIRPSGYRRVARIRKDVGHWLLNVAASELERSPPGTVNLWTMLTDAAFDLDASRSAAPASVAPPGCDWRTEAIRWLRKRAADQSCINASYPLHIGSYKHWALLADQYQRAAEELEAEQAASPFGLDAASPQPTTSAQEVVEALQDAITRMDRARNILTDGNPRPECNWGMLDTGTLRAALAAARKGRK